jgi:hypothetical protein
MLWQNLNTRADQFFKMEIVGGDSRRRFVAARRQNTANRQQKLPPSRIPLDLPTPDGYSAPPKADILRRILVPWNASMPNCRRQIVLLLALLASSGCTAPMQKGKSPLMQAQMSPDSVALDMFFVRFPFGDTTVNDKLWQQIDEQQFSPELRDRLARNGFRVGLISGQMPQELSKLMQLSDKPAPSGELEGAKVTNLETEPRVLRRHLQIRAGQRSEIVASSVYPELSLFVQKAGQLSGKTFNQAQGIFAVKTLPTPDGRIRLELVPELHHDQPKPHWIGSQGVLRLETSRPKEVYDDMTITANVSPGAMLILTSLPNRPGSLGHDFFTDGDNHLEQKLLIVRLSQTQSDPLFNPPEPLKLDQQ